MESVCRLSTSVIRLSKSISKHSLRSFLHCAECVFLAPSGSAKFIAFWCKKNRRATEKYKGVNSFGHLLFDLRDDPQQQHPIHDEAIEARMINLLIRLMKENDAPAEQYRRLGLDVI
ncbi:hypothetical protein GIS72_09925 [Salmonella enterica]|nr:hypothetical protein [Salmonella enterica]